MYLRIGLLGFMLVLVPLSTGARVHQVMVGVFGLFRPNRIEIETEDGTVTSIRTAEVENRRVLAEGQRLLVERGGKQLKVSFLEATGDLLQVFDAGQVSIEEASFTLSVPGQIRRSFFGRVEVAVGRDHLLPRIVVAEEVAVAQILRSEMAECFEPETLKAQAVLVRSYLRSSSGRHAAEGYDFCDTTHCQFLADNNNNEDEVDRFRQATLDSQGLLLTFLGKPFQPMYTASCGGRTLADFSSTGRPHSGYRYRAVACDFCPKHPLFAWECIVQTENLLRILKGIHRDSPVRILARLARPGDEPVLANLRETVRLQVGRSLGWNLIRSNRYIVESARGFTRIKGHGSGHNLGLCQAGAIEMGRQGKSMTDILGFYFPGCQIGRR
ncbi:MAG: hypothetical protein FJW26_16485 [Acidimicrobiia bacterium]|nr:hypothetical protein [Acidimicrobiia bacterium]